MLTIENKVVLCKQNEITEAGALGATAGFVSGVAVSLVFIPVGRGACLNTCSLRTDSMGGPLEQLSSYESGEEPVAIPVLIIRV